MESRSSLTTNSTTATMVTITSSTKEPRESSCPKLRSSNASSSGLKRELKLEEDRKYKPAGINVNNLRNLKSYALWVSYWRKHV